MSKIRFHNKGYFSSDVEARKQLADSLKSWIKEEQAQFINNAINGFYIDPSTLRELTSIESVVKNQSSTGKDIYEAFKNSSFFNANGDEYTFEDARSATPRHLSTFWKVEYLANNKDAGLQDVRGLFSSFHSEPGGEIVGTLKQDIYLPGFGRYLKGTTISTNEKLVATLPNNEGKLYLSGPELRLRKDPNSPLLDQAKTLEVLKERYGIVSIPSNADNLDALYRDLTDLIESIYEALNGPGSIQKIHFIKPTYIRSLSDAYYTAKESGIKIDLSPFKAQIVKAVQAELDDSIEKTNKILNEKGPYDAARHWFSGIVVFDMGGVGQQFNSHWDDVFSPFFDGQKPANFVAMNEKMWNLLRDIADGGK